MADEIKNKNGRELLVDELNDVAGGRLLTSSELDAYFEVDTWVQGKCNYLLNQHKKAEATKLSAALNDAFGSWRNYVKTLPEGSDEVPFSEYFESMYGDLLSQYGYDL